jgi:hypothetical protein
MPPRMNTRLTGMSAKRAAYADETRPLEADQTVATTACSPTAQAARANSISAEPRYSGLLPRAAEGASWEFGSMHGILASLLKVRTGGCSTIPGERCLTPPLQPRRCMIAPTAASRCWTAQRDALMNPVFLVSIEHVDQVHQHTARLIVGFDRFVRHTRDQAAARLADR